MSTSLRVRSRTRAVLICGALAACAAVAGLHHAGWKPRAAAAAPAGPSKVIVLGFDGADANLVQKWMEEGRLPNLARLRSEGCYSPLLAPNPPQTPVSWATFATGLDPGKHEIFDFLKRDVNTYIPDFAMMTPSKAPFLFGPRNPLLLGLGAAFLVLLLIALIAGLATRRLWLGMLIGLVLSLPAFLWARSFVAENIPVKRPVAINNRKGSTFWQVLSEHGVHSTIIRVPGTFPPDSNPEGRLLSGLGVPDIRGTFGTYTYYTSEPPPTLGESTEKGGKVVIVDTNPSTPSLDTIVYGPFNKLFDDPPEINIPLHVDIDWPGKKATIKVSGQELTLREGEWSDFVRFEFPIRKVIRVHGISRFYLMQVGPSFKLYLQAINIDPLDPVIPITYPKSFAKEIYKKIGLWKTLGWALDTWALDEEVTDEQIFADDADFTVGKFEQILDNFIDNPKDRLYCQIFYFTDRAGHMFWRFLDPQNPAYDAAKAGVWGDYILKSYEHMDRIVGKAMAKVPPGGVLIVCSDHGFSTWRTSFNINTWLVRNGFMALKGQGDNKLMTLDDLFVEGTFWPNVDWSRTKAYALGLGCIYINLLGREKDGIVPPGPEYDQVCRDIKVRLEAFVDTTTGVRPVYRVYNRAEMYKDYDPNLIPDLRAANNLGYRVSWQTSLGGIPKDLFEAHKSNWSGDHCSLDPELVKGIFFCSRPVDLQSEPSMVDIFPTLLSLFHVPLSPDLAGHPLAVRK
jgi:predicted AlkP superfamily phosphohydrolase/phosphomutase